MKNQLRIQTIGNKEFIRFYSDNTDLLRDRSMVSPIHYTHGIIHDDQSVEWLFVGKKGYNFLLPKVLTDEINRLMRKYNMPLLLNMHTKDGKKSDYIVNHALIISTRPTLDTDDYKPLIDDKMLLKLNYKPFERKRAIVCTLFPAPKAYLDRLIEISQVGDNQD